MRLGSRILSLILTLALMIGLCPAVTGQAHAAEPRAAGQLIVDSTYGTPGSTIDVAIKIQNNPGILGAKLTIQYDPSLTLVKVENGEAFQALMMQSSNTAASPLVVSWAAAHLPEVKDGNILKLQFKVSDRASLNTMAGVSVTYKNSDMTCEAPNGDLISGAALQIRNGGIQVIHYTPGDVDNSGSVTPKDAIVLLRHLVGGYQGDLSLEAADVDGSGSLNPKDSILILRCIAGGYGVTLKPAPVPNKHNMQATPYKAPTCTEDGNTAYWYCTKCGKYFNDANGSVEIQLADTVLPALGHVEVKIPAKAPTATEPGHTEGVKCSRCGKILVQPEEIPIPVGEQYSIHYVLTDNDPYLEQLLREGELTNPNPGTYSSNTGLQLKPLHLKGYTFKGWVDGYGDSVRSIPANSKGEITLYAKWEATATYTIHFMSEGAPQPVSVEGKTVTSVTKKINQPLKLPEPEMQGYVFLCWTDPENNIVTSIEPGSYGVKTLIANWTSVRNQTIPVNKLDKPLVYEDTERGQLLFIYEIGKIINVPLQELANYGNVIGDGLTWTKETQTQISVSESQAKEISEAISNTTSLSSSWTLSDAWTDSVTCSTEHQVGATKEQTQAMRQSVESGNQWNVSASHGGSTAFTKNSGSSTGVGFSHTTGRVDRTSDHIGADISNTQSGEFNLGVNGELSNVATIGASAVLGIPLKGGAKGELGLEGKNSTGFKVGGHADYTRGWSTTGSLEADHTRDKEVSSGSELSVNHETFSNKTKSDEANWNTGSSFTASQNIKNEAEVSSSVSQMIHDTYGYTSSKDHNTENSKTTAKDESQTKDREYSTTVEYSTEKVDVQTTTITNEGAEKGWYRLVSAGTVHVFGVVGYDIATNSYYTTSYNIIDNEDRYEFFDFSKDDPKFQDRQNGILPFEIPIEVHTLVSDVTLASDHLEIDSDTGIVTGYTGSSQAVVIPDYISVSNGSGTRSAVKVTGISADAFRDNKTLKAIKLSRLIDTIPAYAFSGCSNLETVVSPGLKVIGQSAFSGCSSLTKFTVSGQVTEMGDNAFDGANELVVHASNPDVAQAAVCSGAGNVALWVNQLTEPCNNCKLVIPEGTDSFALYGERSAKFQNVQLVSHARKTVINGVDLNTNGAIVLDLDSNTVDLAWCNVKTDGVAMVLRAPRTDVTIRGNCSMSTSGQNAVLSRTASYTIADHQISSRLAVTGKMLVAGSFSEERDSLVSAAPQYISDREFESILSAQTLYFDANGGTVSPSSKLVGHGKPYGELPTPSRPGFRFDGWFTAPQGGSQVSSSTVNNNFSDVTLYAHWSAIPYTVRWNSCDGCTITVTRTSSPNVGASNGQLSSGSTVYYGDTLSVRYDVHSNYKLTGHGQTSITVAGDVGPSSIYANTQATTCTYKIVYRSSNGTNLGSSSVTHNYGGTYTVSAPSKSGYDTPSSQRVAWDSSNKTITFTYYPSYVDTSPTVASGTWWAHQGTPALTYNVQVELRNRTATTIQARIKWTNRLRANYYYGFGQYYNCLLGDVWINDSVICTASEWDKNSPGSSRDRTKFVYSDWVTLYVGTTDQKRIDLRGQYWQQGQKGHDYSGSFITPAY